MIKERQILFKGPMVRAIIEGRKDVTRRIAKRNHNGHVCKVRKCWHIDDPNAVLACPYGKPGDRLWVKETWAETEQAGIHPADSYIVYRATDPDWETMEGWKWKPSLFMRRAYSRILLEITDVGIERLHSITEKDAQREGITEKEAGCLECGECHEQQERCQNYTPSYRDGYVNLWEEIDGEGSWMLNPWVWRIEFKVIEIKG